MKALASTSASTPMTGRLLQRKCDCGTHSAGPACDSCADEKKKLQRHATGAKTPAAMPRIVGDVLLAPGRPLDAATRAFFEPRFARDFSHVRVHDDARAAQSAQAVGATAWTVGSHIAFDAGAFAPDSSHGRQLLAHELAHTVQQRDGLVSGSGISSPGDSSERAADVAASRVASGSVAGTLDRSPTLLARQTPPVAKGGGVTPPAAPVPMRVLDPAGTPLPPHGPNPADALTPFCAEVAAAKADATIPAAAATWRDKSVAAITAGGPGSGATHQKEIVDNETAEVPKEVTDLNTAVPASQLPKEAPDYRDRLGRICKRKQREVQLEFRYNIILVNTSTGKWNEINDTELDSVDDALGALPENMVWGNAVPTFMSRAHCALEAGECLSNVGGDTMAWAGRKTSDVSIYNSGLKGGTDTRSVGIGITIRQQTIRHEMGHVIDPLVPLQTMNVLFDDIMGFRTWPWNRVETSAAASEQIRIGKAAYHESLKTASNPQSPTLGQKASAYGAGFSAAIGESGKSAAARTDLRMAAGLADDAALEKFLAGLQDDVPVMQNSREFSKVGAGDLYVASTVAGQMPKGKPFTYALTNKGDYFAELFALATSTPVWLDANLPRRQTNWLKEFVFFVPTTEAGWRDTLVKRGTMTKLELANASPQLFSDLMDCYTWKQADAAIDWSIRQQLLPKGTKEG